MAFLMIRRPLLTLRAQAVVNRANVGLQYSSGICGEIFDAAGKLQLQRACSEFGSCGVGEAVVTKGYRLDSDYIIHTVPPRWCGGKHSEDLLLTRCYEQSLKAAARLGVRTVAFPFLSDSCCGYPRDRGLSVARSAILAFPQEEEMMVYLALPEDFPVLKC